MNKGLPGIMLSECEVMVSILCLSFNHERYLRRALDSMIMQETNFRFEILVHDDASTDQSYNIITEYEKKYPLLIKSLKRSDNVYTKGDLLSIWKFFAENANGCFFAFCEGDDYWCSKEKLQKQVSALVARRGDISFHPTRRLNAKTGGFNGIYGKHLVSVEPGESEFIPFSVLGELFITSTIHISSVVISKYAFSTFYDFFSKHPWLDVGDYFIKLMGLFSGAIYLNDCMSVYREFVSGSWSSTREKNIPLQMSHCIKMLAVSKYIMELHDGKYLNLGFRHLQKYTLELHTLLQGTSEKYLADSFYSGLKTNLENEISALAPSNVIYYGAGSIYKSIVRNTDRHIVIDKGVVMTMENGVVISKTAIETYVFPTDDIIVITPLFRGVSIRDELISKWAPYGHYIVLDDLLSIDFVNNSIFSSVKEYLCAQHKIKNISHLLMC